MLQPARKVVRPDEFHACHGASLSEVQESPQQEDMELNPHPAVDVEMASPAPVLPDQASEQPSPARSAGQRTIADLWQLTPSKRKQPLEEDPSAKAARELDEPVGRPGQAVAQERHAELEGHDEQEPVHPPSPRQRRNAVRESREQAISVASMDLLMGRQRIKEVPSLAATELLLFGSPNVVYTPEASPSGSPVVPPPAPPDTLKVRARRLLERIREGKDATPAQQAKLDVKYGTDVARIYERGSKVEKMEPDVAPMDLDVPAPVPAPQLGPEPEVTMEEYIQERLDVENESLPDLASSSSGEESDSLPDEQPAPVGSLD